jgi:hypothetical protein
MLTFSSIVLFVAGSRNADGNLLHRADAVGPSSVLSGVMESIQTEDKSERSLQRVIKWGNIGKIAASWYLGAAGGFVVYTLYAMALTKRGSIIPDTHRAEEIIPAVLLMACGGLSGVGYTIHSLRKKILRAAHGHHQATAVTPAPETPAPAAPKECTAHQDKETCDGNLCQWTVGKGWFFQSSACGEFEDLTAVAPLTGLSHEGQFANPYLAAMASNAPVPGQGMPQLGLIEAQ